jgi:hypothetical protein
VGRLLASVSGLDPGTWQSEFLQMVWQAVGLALLFLWGSSQSMEGDERIEAKLDRLLEERGVDPDEVTRTVNESL